MEGDTTESPLSLVVPQTGGGMHTAEPKFPPARSNFFPYSSPPLSGSAVSALQCKVKKKYQVKTAWKEDQLCEIATVPPVKKREDGESLLCSSIQSSIQAKRSSSSDEEMVVPQFQVQPFPSLDSSLKVKRNMSGPGERDLMSSGAAEIPRGLGEGSSVENLALSAACDSQNDGSPSKATSASSSRPWAPPKGFWRVARPETLLLNGGGLSPLPPAKEGTPDCVDLPQRKAKMKMSRGHRLTQSKMQRADSLESAFSRCAQWEGSVASPLGGLWRADSWEGVCSPGGSLEERVKRFPEKHGDKVKKASVMMTEEAQYHNSEDMFKGLPPYEQSDWETAIITYESELNYRSMFSAADWTLSPRHEQAKRLLERARLKARNQSPQDEPTNQPAQRDGPEFVPVVGASALQRTVLVTAHEDLLVPPVHLLEVRGRDYNRRTCPRRNGQSPTRVRFEDESEKEAERRYLERVRERGPVEKPPVERLSKSEPIVSVSNFSRGLGVNWGMVDIPLPRLSKKVEDQTLEILVPQEVASRKCEACGSILGPAGALPSKPQLSNTKLQVRTVPRWVTPSQSSHNPQPTVLPGLTFTGGLSLVDSVGGVGEAGETVSAFGKLRRRSRKGESRAETSHGPYARSQNIWAQRRNSKTCSNVEDRSVSASQPVSIGGLTFVIDPPPPLEQTLPTAPTSCAVSGSPSQPMPIKSALKSGSKNRQSGQRVVKLLPSVQYRLIQLDQEGQGGPHLFSLPPEEQLSVNLSHPTQTLSSTSGLSPCIRPSSLRYSSALLTPDLQALEISAAGLIAEEDESLSLMNSCVGGLPPECRSALRGGKADGLRAELLRAEHRKAESQWDDGVSGSRRAVEREGRPRLSLRRFFSAMGLNSVGKLVKGNRSSSMDHLSSPSARHASVSPTPPHKAPAVLQRTPSLQSLHTESPLAQLRKASSAQSLQSPKRRAERSTILGEIPLPYCLPTREIQSEGLEAACGAGPQGRLVQAFPDGTLLLELTRPANEPFGFVISRGKGRPDSGIYVEQVGGNSAENIYTGLLGVGDEILEVNGEKVAGQTLDQVTRLLTRNSTATIRIVPHRWIQH